VKKGGIAVKYLMRRPCVINPKKRDKDRSMRLGPDENIYSNIGNGKTYNNQKNAKCSVECPV
jgi:hypothetical protein